MALSAANPEPCVIVSSHTEERGEDVVAVSHDPVYQVGDVIDELLFIERKKAYDDEFRSIS